MLLSNYSHRLFGYSAVRLSPGCSGIIVLTLYSTARLSSPLLPDNSVVLLLGCPATTPLPAGRYSVPTMLFYCIHGYYPMSCSTTAPRSKDSWQERLSCIHYCMPFCRYPKLFNTQLSVRHRSYSSTTTLCRTQLLRRDAPKRTTLPHTRKHKYKCSKSKPYFGTLRPIRRTTFRFVHDGRRLLLRRFPC